MSISASIDRPMRSGLALSCSLLALTEDAKEGLKAFSEKRKGVFTGT